MAKLTLGTPVWYVKGASYYHPLTNCSRLEGEKSKFKDTATSHIAGRIDSMGETGKFVGVCPECFEKFKDLPDPPDAQSEISP